MTNEERMPMIGAIRGSTTRPILENMFEKFGVVETQAKVEALKEAMNNPQVFFSSGELDAEQQYETLVGAFLSGVWKRGGEK
jgi:hypothetical protein